MTSAAQIREKPIAVLGLAFGLLVVLGIYVAPLLGGARDLEGDEYLDEHFEVTQLPFGYSIKRAVALVDGRRIIVIGDPDAARVELPDDPDPESDSNTDSESQPPARKDHDSQQWARLEEGEAGQPPDAIALVHYPLARAADVLRWQFGELQYKDLTHLDDDGEVVPIDSGHLDWGPYPANFVRLRHFTKESGLPTFHDSLRVNLTLGDRCWIAFLRWEPFLPGHRAAAEELLAGLRPLPR